MRAKYGILDDVFNFDETGYMLGIALISEVVTTVIE
jgi:hypothetical protein